MKPGKHGFARITAAVRYSRDGLAAAYRNEAAFRQLVWLHAVLLPLACCFDFAAQLVALLLVGVFWLMAFNTL